MTTRSDSPPSPVASGSAQPNAYRPASPVTASSSTYQYSLSDAATAPLNRPSSAPMQTPRLQPPSPWLGSVRSSGTAMPDFVRATSYRHSRYSSALSDASGLGIVDDLPAPKGARGWTRKELEADDAMHEPGGRDDSSTWAFFNTRGIVNLGGIIFLLTAVILVFAGYPIIYHYTRPKIPGFGFNLGGVNGSGQLPDFPGMPLLIDPQTPNNARTKTGLYDGQSYHLVFSDEFNTDGRSFFTGDDPFWEAVDLYYWPTADYEWYSPEAITTKDGKLQITITEMNNHALNWQSGMLQSWNKLCFTTGILEASISIAGDGVTPGLWPGFWTMGNLGRPGYGATTDGMWPYSYAACDIGTLPNQTYVNQTGPPAALTGGWQDNHHLSWLPGQRLSACTCPNTASEDHPGPSVTAPRGVPEIDVIEAQIDTSVPGGQVSQSFQVAPFDPAYIAKNTSDVSPIYDTTITKFNDFHGSHTQQALSGVTEIGSANYGGNGYETYGFEWWADPKNRQDGYISWHWGEKKTWTVTAGAVGPNPRTMIGQRLIPEEPMAIVLNLGMANGFQPADFTNLKFPYTMYIDWVRIYQRDDIGNNLSCDPPNYPTADYIANHAPAYNNPNVTTWNQAGYQAPGNSLKGEC